MTDSDTDRAVRLIDQGLGPIGYVTPEAASWRDTDNMAARLRSFVATIPQGRPVRFDVATLTATLNLTPAAVPALRAALDRATRDDTPGITAEAPTASHDQVYVLGR